MNAQLHEVAQGQLIAGDAHTIPALMAYVEARGIAARGNPDMYVREYRTFGIAEARELRDRATGRAILGDRRVFVVVTPSMTVDAQNALLKTLEEPSAGALFFFIVPSPHMLISTLLSRMQILSLDSKDTKSAIDVNAFLAASPERRIDLLKPLYTHEDDERDIRGALDFLQHLEKALAPRIKERGVHAGIVAIYRARRYLTDKGALLKPLLEQVALLSPRV